VAKKLRSNLRETLDFFFQMWYHGYRIRNGGEIMEVYLRLPQVERMTGIDAVTLWRMCRRGILPHRRYGRYYEVRLSDVEKLAAAADLVESAKHSTIRQCVALARAGIVPQEEEL
jgi:hypothetical protein